MPAQKSHISNSSTSSSSIQFANNASPLKLPYSCNACRRRKIRCDKQQPCSYCTKIKATCIYASSTAQHSRESRIRQPNTTTADSVRVDRSAGLPEHVQRLESHVHDLEARVRSLEGCRGERLQTSAPHTNQGPAFERRSEDMQPTPMSSLGGRLWEVIDTERSPDGDQQSHGKQRSRTDQQEPSSADAPLSFVANYLFGLRNEAVSFPHGLELRTEFIQELVQIYQSNVHPLVPILDTTNVIQSAHNPTLSQHARVNGQTIFAAICYAALSSLQQSQHSSQHVPPNGPDRATHVSHFRELTNHLLFGPKATILKDPSLATLQALTLYIIAGRRDFSPAYTLSLTSVLVRLATKLQYYKLPASGEDWLMKDGRRKNALWLQIVMLDTGVAEANNVDPMIHVSEHEMQQLLREAHVIPSTRPHSAAHASGLTDQTAIAFIQHVRLLVIRVGRAVLFSPHFNHANDAPKLDSTAEKIQYISRLEAELDKDIQEEHKKVTSQDYADRHLMDLHDFSTLTTIARMLISKMKLAVYMVGHKTGTGCPNESFEAFARESMGILQRSAEIASTQNQAHYGAEPRKRWMWMSQYLLEPDAAAILMACLARKSHSHNVDILTSSASEKQLVQSAEMVLDDFFARWRDRPEETKGSKWDQLRRMREKLDPVFARFRDVKPVVEVEQIDWSDVPGFDDEQLPVDFDQWISANFFEGFEMEAANLSWL